jgi:hypothetical protein
VFRVRNPLATARDGVVMEAYDAAYNHIPDDVGTFMVLGDLVQEFLEWMYDGKEKPEWIPE